MKTDRLMDLVFPGRDQSLAKVVASLSEPETGRAADNLMTNEDSFARVANDLATVAPPNGVYLGVGPDQNFSLIAQSRPTLAFVVDFRRRNALLHFVHKALMAMAPDRQAYLARLLGRRPRLGLVEPSSDQLVESFEGLELDRAWLDSTIVRVAETLGPLGLVQPHEWPELAVIQAKLAGPGLNARFLAMPMYPRFGRLIRSRDRLDQPAHFLAREGWYQAVRELEVGDRVVPLVGDFGGPTALPAVGQWLRLRGLGVSVLYISDVEFFLLRSERFDRYVANLRQLPWLEGAVLIRTSTREISHPDRLPGDSSTTILRPVERFLQDAEAGRIQTLDDLFR